MADPFSLVVEPIVSSVIEEAKSLIRNRIDLLEGVEKDIEKLTSNLTAIQAVLHDAEDKQTDSRQLRDWLGKLEEAAYDAEDLLQTFQTEAFLWQKKKQVRTIPISSGQVAFKYGAAKKIKNLLERLDEIGKEKEKFGLSNLAVKVETSDDRKTTNFVNETDVLGREEDKNKIIEMLKSEEFNREGSVAVVSIIGMGGLGKTTLAQLIYNNEGVKSQFVIFMWAYVSYNFNYISILKEMIECHSKMKLADIDASSPSLIESRFVELITGKRILFVLDDVWTESYDDWDKLERFFKHAGEGSKVLVTSRSTKVFSLNRKETQYPLEGLPEHECWSLFHKIASIEWNSPENVHSDLENIGRQIVRKCEGLPLAVRAMGGLLRGNNDVNKWKKIRDDDIWKAEIPTNNAEKATILPALKLSYDHLPSHIKKCFAFCYIFPKAYVFNKMELIKLWKGASLILSTKQNTTGGTGNIQSTPDEIGFDFFGVLLRMSFFQLSKAHKEESYLMHDLIHDLAQSVSIPQCYQVDDKKTCDTPERIRHVSMLCEKVEEPVLEVINNSMKLRTLLAPTGHLKDFGQSLDKLFHTMKYVRALDLSSSTISELPKSVEELKLLCYLDLSKTEIKWLPNSICNLYHLQTLKLLGCPWLFEFPKRLANLVNLQHLELDSMFWHKCRTLPPRMGSLTILVNLHAFPVSPKDGWRISELKNMNRLTGNLHISKLEHAVNAREAALRNKERLDEVAFEWSYEDGGSPHDGDDAHERVLQDLEPHSNVRKIKISNYRGVSFPSWVRGGLLQNLVTVSLINCTQCKVLSLSQLPYLGKLYIKGMLQLEEWKNEEYKSLDTLKISKCPNLRELPYLFGKLRVLKINGCDSLKALPVTPFLVFLILIDNLLLENWNEVPVLVSTVTDQGQHLTRRQPSFINVIELKIKNCPRMPELPKVFGPQKLEISGCPLLTTLPNPNFSKRLQHLALEGYADGKLVNSIPHTTSLYSLVISNISGLTSLHQWPSLPGLKTLYIHQCPDLEFLSEGGEVFLHGVNSLTLLSIRDCPKLMIPPGAGLPSTLQYLSIDSCNSLKLLGPRDILKSLSSLKDLYIENCLNLESLPEGGLPASLRHLRIAGCPLLEKECEKDNGPYRPQIELIQDVEIEYSNGVSSDSNSAKQTKHSKMKSFFAASNRGQSSHGKQEHGKISISAKQSQ